MGWICVLCRERIKITRTVAKVGGPVSIGFLLNDMQNDYQMYSGRELVKAWGANLIPVATGLGVEL